MIIRSLKILHVLYSNSCIIPFEWLRIPRYIYVFFGFFYFKNLAKINPQDNSQADILTKTLIQLGPSFVKLGQALSVRPDLVGENFAINLRSLQDSMPTFSGEEAILIIESEFGKPINQLFSSFEKVPKAAASIAQVHKAKTLDGETVAVKLMRPSTKQAMYRDIKYFKRLAKFLEFFSKKARRLRAIEAIETFASWTEKELDFITEAIYSEKLATNFQDEPKFIPPKVYWNLTNNSVLTIEWIDGVRIDNIAEIRKMGFEPGEILAYSIQVFFLQVFRDGFFHGDVHPGNIFITSEGIIRPLDFGIMGILTKDQRQNLSSLLLGFIKRDYEKCAQAMIDLNFLRNKSLKQSFASSLSKVVEPNIYKSRTGISVAQVFFEIINLAEDFDIIFDPSFLLLNKTMLQAEGTGKIVEPKKNIWLLTEEVMEKWLLETNSFSSNLEKFVSKVMRAMDDYSNNSQDDNYETMKGNNKSNSLNLSIILWLVVSFALGFAISYKYFN